MNKAHKITLVADSKAIVYLKTKDRRIAWLIDKIGDIECSYHDNRYAFVIEEIIGQMLSNKVAAIITEKLIGLCNGDVTPNHVKALSYEQLRLIGLSNSKNNYIQIFTDAVLNVERFIEGLLGITGANAPMYGVAATGLKTVPEPAMPIPSGKRNFKILWSEPLTWHLAKKTP